MNIRHLLAVSALLVIGTSVRAQAPNPLITIDENGNGSIDFTKVGGIFSNMPGVLQADPGPGGLPSVMTYNLLGPPSLVAGDVFLTDGHFGNITEDVIRFNPAGTGGNANYPASVLFYSDPIDGFDSGADTPTAP